MRRLFALAFVLAGCSIAPLDLTGKRCPCPQGYECALATNTCTREAPPIDGAVDDSGMLIDMMPCPDTHDEDGDGRGDSCDVCPGDSDNGHDTDGDGVGDVCDPSATTNERIVFFHSFETLPNWTITGSGTWRLENDSLVSDSGAGVISNFTILDPVPGKISYLVTRVTLGAEFDPQGSTNYVSLVRQHDSVADSSVRCVVSRLPPADPLFGLRDTGAVPALRSEVPYTYTVGQDERFQFKKDGTDYVCSSRTETVTGTSTVTTNNPHLGLRTRSGAATYHWVMLLVQDP